MKKYEQNVFEAIGVLSHKRISIGPTSRRKGMQGGEPSILGLFCSQIYFPILVGLECIIDGISWVTGMIWVPRLN